MTEEIKEKVLSVIRRDKSLKFKLEGWKNRMHPQWNILDVWECIYRAAEGNANIMADMVIHLTDKVKVYGRANAAYGNAASNGMDIVKDEQGVMQLKGYDPNHELTRKGLHGHTNDRIFRKSDDVVNKNYQRTEATLLNIGARLRKLYPTADNHFLTMALQSVKKTSEATKKNIGLIMSRLERGAYKFDKNFNIVKKEANENIVRGRSIIITEEMARQIKEELEMTEYKFHSNIRQFLHDLLVDPVNAKPSSVLTQHGLNRQRLLYHLLKRGVIEKEENISDKDENGNFKTATMKVKYRVPKKNLDRKLQKLYIRLFEENIPPKEEPITEDGECGVMGGATSADCSGQYEAPMFGIQRRKLQTEDTTLDSIGDYQYDVPFTGDDEVMKRGNGVGGSTSINHV